MTSLPNVRLNPISMQLRNLQDQFRRNQSDIDRKDFEAVQAEEEEMEPLTENQNSSRTLPRLELETYTRLPIDFGSHHPDHLLEQNKESQNPSGSNGVSTQPTQGSGLLQVEFGSGLPEGTLVQSQDIEQIRQNLPCGIQQQLEQQLPDNTEFLSDSLLILEECLEEYSTNNIDMKNDNQDNTSTTTKVVQEKQTEQVPEKQTGQKE